MENNVTLDNLFSQPKGWMSLHMDGHYWTKEKVQLVSAWTTIITYLAIQRDFVKLGLPHGPASEGWDFAPDPSDLYQVVEAAARMTWIEPPMTVLTTIGTHRWDWKWCGQATPGRWVKIEVSPRAVILSWDSGTDNPSKFIEEVFSTHLSREDLEILDDWGGPTEIRSGRLVKAD
jgi:hypothetical protein